MIVVCNRIPVNPAHAEAFEERFAAREGLVDGMPGFVSFQVLRPTNEDDPYVVMTFWETREHFDAWVNSDKFKSQHAQSRTLPEDAFRGRPKIEVHEIIQRAAAED